MTPKRLIAIAMHIDQPYANHHQVFSGIRRFAGENPHWTFVIDEHPDYEERGGQSGRRRYDGVIGRLPEDTQGRLRHKGIPHVNTMYVSANPKVAGVYVDTPLSGRLAAEHLIERGFRRAAYLGLSAYKQGEDIGANFARSMVEAGCECPTTTFRWGMCDDRRYWLDLKEHVEGVMDKLKPPVGILASLPWLARLLITLCGERGWHVPQQVAVMCVDNWREAVEMPPQITCIDANHEVIGYEAAALLERIMDGRASPRQKIHVPPLGLVTRESTDYFSVEDEAVARALRYISKHLADHLNVEQIAHEVSVSPRSLQRRFESALNRPVAEEIRRLRLEKAKRMLGEKDRWIAEIARAAGFKSPITMNNVFHRELGMGPREYRKRILGRANTPSTPATTAE